jgi:hypothetical protein
MSEKKAVLYTTIGSVVIGNEETWDTESNLEKLNDVFYGAVDVIGLRPAMNGKVGYDAWVKDDALETGTAGAFQIQFGTEYYGMAWLPQGKAIVVLAVTEDGKTIPLNHDQALEVQANLVVGPWKRGVANAE